MQTNRLSLLLAMALAIVGCGDDDTTATPDASGGSADSGPSRDAQPGDTASDDDAGQVGCVQDPLCMETAVVVLPDWLEMHLDDPDVQIVDTRERATAETERAPGAVHIDVGALRTTVDGVGGQVVDAAAAESVFQAAGLSETAKIVVYGDSTTTTPARLVWTLHYFGHSNAALLDGGFDRWTSESRPTESGSLSVEPSNYTIGSFEGAVRVDADFILDSLDGGDEVALVDARSQAEFDAGHIPGALSVDWMRQVQSGSLLEQADLLALYTSLDSSETAVTYCQTGSRASVSYVVLRQLGFTDVRLYDGSWAEWGARADTPKEP